MAEKTKVTTDQTTTDVPAEAMLYIAGLPCPTCEGSKWVPCVNPGGNSLHVCRDCLDAEGEPTGYRFWALSVGCNCEDEDCPCTIGPHSALCTFCVEYVKDEDAHGRPNDDCLNCKDMPICGGTGRVPISWKDERAIREALDADGWLAFYDPWQGWTVQPQGRVPDPLEDDDPEGQELAVACRRALEAEANDG